MRGVFIVGILILSIHPVAAFAAPSVYASSPEGSGTPGEASPPPATNTPTPTPCPDGTSFVGGECRPPCPPKEIRTQHMGASCICVEGTNRDDPRAVLDNYHYCTDPCPLSARYEVICDVATGCQCKDKCIGDANPLYSLEYNITTHAGIKIFPGTGALLDKCRDIAGNTKVTAGNGNLSDENLYVTL